MLLAESDFVPQNFSLSLGGNSVFMLAAMTGRPQSWVFVSRRSMSHPGKDGILFGPYRINSRVKIAECSRTKTDAQPLPTLGKNYDAIEADDTCRSIATRNNLSLLDL